MTVQISSPRPRHRGHRVLVLTTKRVLFIVALLLVYALIVTFMPQASRSLPDLSSLVTALFTGLGSAELWVAVGETMLAVSQAFIICVAVGVSVGVLLAAVPGAFASARTVIDFVRTIPPLAIIPIGLLLLGPTLRMEIVLIVFTAVWPMVLQSYTAVKSIDVELVETARVYHVTGRRRLFQVVIPGMLPVLVTGVRLTVVMCLLLAIGTELLARSEGLGALIRFYQNAKQMPDAFAVIIITGIIGILLNALIAWLERRLLAWNTSERIV